MRLKIAVCSALLLSGCNPCPIPVKVSVKEFTRQEQQEIANEHNSMDKDDIGRAVFEDWERMRRELR